MPGSFSARQERFALRVPWSWGGSLDSPRMTGFLADWFQRTHALAPDPGAGERQITLSLPARAVRTFAAAVDEPIAVALRRLAATRLGYLPARRPMPALPPASFEEPETYREEEDPPAYEVTDELHDPHLDYLFPAPSQGVQIPEPEVPAGPTRFEVFKLGAIVIGAAVLVFWLIFRWLKSLGPRSAEIAEAEPAYFPWTPSA